MNLRVMVVDDSVVFRRLIGDALNGIPGVEVIGSAMNGETALARISELAPDLITLDLEMPIKGGLEVLKEIRRGNWEVGVVVVSSHTQRSLGYAVSALDLGAFEIVPKPSGGSPEANRKELSESLEKVIQAFRNRQPSVRVPLREVAGWPPPASSEPAVSRTPGTVPEQASSHETGSAGFRTVPKPAFILIGSSTGGPVALSDVLSGFPANLDVPVFIVQHMPPLFTAHLAKNLSKKTKIPIKEGEHGETARPNVGYIAPGGKHLGLKKGPDSQVTLNLSEAPPENGCRPAVDFLFRSAANGFPGKALAVVLTGMGSDGLLGVRLLKRHGCFSIAQSRETCSVFGMPKAIVEADLADAVLSPGEIAGTILRILKGFPV